MGEAPVAAASYVYTAPDASPEEVARVNAVVQEQNANWQATSAARLARLNALADSASARARQINAELCVQPGWPYGCGANPCFGDVYRAGMPVGYGNPDAYKDAGYVGISCVPPGGGNRTWHAPDVPASVIVSQYAAPANFAPPTRAGQTAPLPSTSGTGTTPTAMPTPTNAPGGFQTSATPGRNYAGYLPPAAAAASVGGSNPVSTAGGIVGGIPALSGGISPVVLAMAAAAAWFFFKGGK
jgi:hypothetical protein